jgi:Ca2+-binding RTX toxin-like protein
MPYVTVPGGADSNITLSYDSDGTAALARQVAAAISAGLDDPTIQSFNNKSGLPPTLPAGMTGEFVQSVSGRTPLPAGYDFVVDSAKHAVIFGNGDPNEQVLAGNGSLTYVAGAGAGSVIAGGGKDKIDIGQSDPGNWLIALGNGNDTIRALGTGNDTVSVGSGKDQIKLGNGGTFLTTHGADTVLAGSGSETIDASRSKGGDVVYGNTSSLDFLAGGGATVQGGSGSDTVYCGKGMVLFEGGSGGNNYLQAGSGRATVVGGGNGDQLFAAGHKEQLLEAASGNETLSGIGAFGADTFKGGSGSDQVFGGSGTNTFIAGSGASTVTANPGAKNLFDFVKGAGGGNETVQGLTSASQVNIELSGFGPHEIKYALDHQTTTDGSVTIKLSDSTTVTFLNIASLSSSNFSLDPGAGKDGFDKDRFGQDWNKFGPPGDHHH